MNYFDWTKEIKNNSKTKGGERMSETRYTRQTGVELNKDNLTAILGQLIQSDYIEFFKVNLLEKYIIVTDDKVDTTRFDFGDHLEITKDTIKPAGENNTTYTGYWLYKPDALEGLYYADNVQAYSIDKESKVIYIHTEHKSYTMDMKKGVIVFDDNENFVEVFKPDTLMLESAMMEHGYKKVK